VSKWKPPILDILFDLYMFYLAITWDLLIWVIIWIIRAIRTISVERITGIRLGIGEDTER